MQLDRGMLQGNLRNNAAGGASGVFIKSHLTIDSEAIATISVLTLECIAS